MEIVLGSLAGEEDVVRAAGGSASSSVAVPLANGGAQEVALQRLSPIDALEDLERLKCRKQANGIRAATAGRPAPRKVTRPSFDKAAGLPQAPEGGSAGCGALAYVLRPFTGPKDAERQLGPVLIIEASYKARQPVPPALRVVVALEDPKELSHGGSGAVATNGSWRPPGPFGAKVREVLQQHKLELPVLSLEQRCVSGHRELLQHIAALLAAGPVQHASPAQNAETKTQNKPPLPAAATPTGRLPRREAPANIRPRMGPKGVLAERPQRKAEPAEAPKAVAAPEKAEAPSETPAAPAPAPPEEAPPALSTTAEPAAEAGGGEAAPKALGTLPRMALPTIQVGESHFCLPLPQVTVQRMHELWRPGTAFVVITTDHFGTPLLCPEGDVRRGLVNLVPDVGQQLVPLYWQNMSEAATSRTGAARQPSQPSLPPFEEADEEEDEAP